MKDYYFNQILKHLLEDKNVLIMCSNYRTLIADHRQLLTYLLDNRQTFGYVSHTKTQIKLKDSEIRFATVFEREKREGWHGEIEIVS